MPSAPRFSAQAPHRSQNDGPIWKTSPTRSPVVRVRWKPPYQPISATARATKPRLAEIFPAQATIRHTLRHLARWMKPKRVSVSLELMPATARIIYQPVGVVGIISPWNYPFQLSILPLMAAIAAGDCVMLKPSELTPRTSAFLAEFLAGLFPADKVATWSAGRRSAQAFSRLPFDHLLLYRLDRRGPQWSCRRPPRI